eukprot:g44992.t1
MLLQFAGGVIVTLEKAQDGHVTQGRGGGVKIVGNQMVLSFVANRSQTLYETVTESMLGLNYVEDTLGVSNTGDQVGECTGEPLMDLKCLMLPDLLSFSSNFVFIPKQPCGINVIGLQAPEAEYEAMVLQFAGGVIVTLEKAQEGHVTQGRGGGVKIVGDWKVLSFVAYRSQTFYETVIRFTLGLTNVEEATLGGTNTGDQVGGCTGEPLLDMKCLLWTLDGGEGGGAGVGVQLYIIQLGLLYHNIGPDVATSTS